MLRFMMGFGFGLWVGTYYECSPLIEQIKIEVIILKGKKINILLIILQKILANSSNSPQKKYPLPQLLSRCNASR